MGVSLVIRVDADGRIPENSFRTGGGYRKEFFRAFNGVFKEL